jgi:hypothetical protein
LRHDTVKRKTKVSLLILSMLIILIGIALPVAAEIIQIGDGSLYNMSLPMEPYAMYSYSQSVYTQAEITTAGIISQIGWQYRINGTIFLANTNQISIYLGVTNRSGFTSLTDWVPVDSLTLVFTGMLSPAWFTSALPGQGWLNIPLQTAFNYNGSGNLVIAVDENMPGNSSQGDDFNCHNVTSPRSIECHSFTINPDPANPPAANAGNPLSVRPNLKLDIEPLLFAPHSPNPADLAIDVPVSTSLSWQSTADSWDVWFAENGQSLAEVSSGLTSPVWTPAGELDLFHDYEWRVTAYAGGEVYEGIPWHFTTMGETLTAPQNLSALCIGQTVRLDWSPPEQGSVMSYRIFRNGIQIEECQSLQFTDIAVVVNQTYSYYVKAVNHLNQISPPSNTAIITVYGYQVYLCQGFETAADFSSDIPDWTIIDEDNSLTWEWDFADFPNEGDALGWIIFNPAQTTPPANAVLPYGGSKMLLSMAALNPPNDDWLISPPLQILNGYELTFQARSYSGDYGLERLRLLVSTTDSLLTSFQLLSAEPWLPVPAGWTEYSYDLSGYAGERIYLAWQCLSWDSFALCLDDIVITRSVSIQDETGNSTPGFRIYPNPARDMFKITSSASAPFDMCIYNTKGQKLYQKTKSQDFEWSKASGIQLPAGIYIIHLQQGSRFTLKKVVIFP